MKTITIFSYKGGTGKSFTLANFAVCLARQGFSVALLDTDVDAPGLHHKFPDDAVNAAERHGLVGLLWRSVHQSNSDFKLTYSPFHGDGSTVVQYVHRLQYRHADGGAIHLISAGNIESREYLEFFTDSRWWTLFAHASVEPSEDMSLEALAAVKFLMGIKQEISKLDPNPDYLLVDLRGGILDANSFVIRYWADSVVVMFPPNPENLSFAPDVIKRLKNIKRGVAHLSPHLSAELLGQIPDGKIDVVPVLSRTPPAMDQKGQETRINIKHALGMDDDDTLLELHSDRSVEIWEHLIFPLEGQTVPRRLADEQIRLFARVESGPDSEVLIEKTAREIRKAVELRSSSATEDRVFQLDRATGHLVNPNDSTRNVSFSVLTFNLLLEGLRDSMCESLQQLQAINIPDEFQPNEVFLNALHHAGYVCGRRFGKSLRDEVWTPTVTSAMTIRSRLMKWCEFDTDVGFGQFDLRLTPHKGKATSGIISVNQSFLRLFEHERGDAGSALNDHSRCKLLSGYIQGVVTELCSETAVVDKSACQVHHSESGDTCNYRFELSTEQ